MDWMSHAAYIIIALALLIAWVNAEYEKYGWKHKYENERDEKNALNEVRMDELNEDWRRFGEREAEKNEQIAALQIDLKTARVISEGHWANARGGEGA